MIVPLHSRRAEGRGEMFPDPTVLRGAIRTKRRPRRLQEMLWTDSAPFAPDAPTDRLPSDLCSLRTYSYSIPVRR